MVRYIEREHALLSFGVPGMALILIGLMLGLHVVESYSRTGQPALGLGLLTVLAIVLGMLLAFTGLILHAVINASRLPHRP